MPIETWLLFVITMTVVSATPGPNMLLALSHGLRYGVRRSLYSCSGMLIGMLSIMTASVAGIGALLATSELLFSVIKYAGAAYLLYLGIKLWRAKPDLDLYTAKPEDAGSSAFALFRSGFFVAFSNPKAFIFFTALFPQFMGSSGPQVTTLAILVTTLLAIETTWLMIYCGGGSRLSRFLRTPSRITLVNRVSGSLFVVMAIVLTTAKRT